MRDYLCGKGMSHDLWQGPDTGDNALNSLHRLQVDIHGSDDLCVYDGQDSKNKLKEFKDSFAMCRLDDAKLYLRIVNGLKTIT
ncbi:hypothetical protein P5673_024049 [Acropora cervicornis]|uniref:Uncharacterized protein n=1 Tax=Acropora cervicornis TaxID=6130 RepID=A0AAD9Q468_ACRCE|nr:hypothetical protein P5673_024049 [Acropora cervicornis]